jgi:DNA-directed RNA polymerase specialized sigma24 family protein
MSDLREQWVQEALNHLLWLERSCLLLSICTDFTQQEMAEILQITQEEVSKATLQGRERFQRAYHQVKQEAALAIIEPSPLPDFV